MGWASGSQVMSDIIDGVKKQFPDNFETRKKLYILIIEALEMSDWDTQDECMEQDKAYDEAIDRKSTRLNSSHLVISYAVFC